MPTTHISETDLADNIPALLSRVRAGEAFVIEAANQPVAYLRPVDDRKGNTVAEVLTLMREDTRIRGYEVTVDDDFARDVQEVIDKR